MVRFLPEVTAVVRQEDVFGRLDPVGGTVQLDALLECGTDVQIVRILVEVGGNGNSELQVGEIKILNGFLVC